MSKQKNKTTQNEVTQSTSWQNNKKGAETATAVTESSTLAFPSLATAEFSQQAGMIQQMPAQQQVTMLAQMGQLHGNQHVQRLVADMNAPAVQRREDNEEQTEDASEMISDQDIQYEMLAHHLAYQDSFDGPIEQLLRRWGYDPAWAAVVDDQSTGFFMGLIMPDEAHADLTPVLAFRGTEGLDLSDITADLNPSSVGANQFFINQHIVEQFIDDAGGTVDVVGHSLGGALAQHAAAAFPSSVRRVVTFQSPGISTEEVESFQDAQDRPDVTHHIADGDVVDTAGDGHLEGDFFRHSPGGIITPHTKFLLLSPEFKERRDELGITDEVLAEMGIEAEENKNPIEHSEEYPHAIKNAIDETARSGLGMILYPILNGIQYITRDDDTVIRTGVENLSVEDLAQRSTGERSYMVDRLCRGFTGDADELAILKLLQSSEQAGDLVKVVDTVSAFKIVENVHGEEYDTLHTFLQAYYYPEVGGTEAMSLIQQCVDDGLSEWQEEMIADILVFNPASHALIEIIGDVYGEGGFDEGLNQVEWWLDGDDQKRVAAVHGSTGRWW